MAETPNVDVCVKEALEALRVRPGRGPDGRFAPGNIEGGDTLERSSQLQALLAPAKATIVARVTADIGASADGPPETLQGLIEALAEIRLFRQSMFLRLTEGPNAGPVTAKGKTKALYGAYVAAVDREMRLAQLIGLERRHKRIDLARALSEGSQG